MSNPRAAPQLKFLSMQLGRPQLFFISQCGVNGQGCPIGMSPCSRMVLCIGMICPKRGRRGDIAKFAQVQALEIEIVSVGDVVVSANTHDLCLSRRRKTFGLRYLADRNDARPVHLHKSFADVRRVISPGLLMMSFPMHNLREHLVKLCNSLTEDFAMDCLHICLVCLLLCVYYNTFQCAM